MKKGIDGAIQATVAIEENLKSLTVDEINKQSPKGLEPEVQEMSLKEKAKKEGARYIEPKRRLSPPLGKLPEKLQKQHKHDWEYVKGIYENYIIVGEAITFSLCLYAGDPDYMWEIPANVAVYVPRMIAKHLEEVQAYHTFKHIERPSHEWHTDSETHQLKVTGTHYRGKFRPIGAFS